MGQEAISASARGEQVFNEWRASQPDPHNILRWGKLAPSTQNHWIKRAMYGRASAPSREQKLEAVVRAGVDDMMRLHAALGFSDGEVIDADKMLERIAALGKQGLRRTALPTNDAVYAEVQRQRGNRYAYVSTNAVNDVMAAVRSLIRAPLPARDLALTNDGNEPDWDAYAALERQELGDADKGTGIYHPDNVAAGQSRAQQSPAEEANGN